MWVIVILFLLCIVLYFFATKMGKIDQNIRDKRMEPINKMLHEYEEKLKIWCNNNGVTFRENITKTHEIRINETPGYYWFDDKNFIFCQDALMWFGNPINIDEGITFIKYENIKYYSKDGSISYTNEIVSNGKNVSISGAVVGGLIAGEAGAIIGSMKDREIKNVTVQHDDVHTYMYYEADGAIKLLDIKGNDFYQRILHLMPEKEYNYLLNKNNI